MPEHEDETIISEVPKFSEADLAETSPQFETPERSSSPAKEALAGLESFVLTETAQGGTNEYPRIV